MKSTFLRPSNGPPEENFHIKDDLSSLSKFAKESPIETHSGWNRKIWKIRPSAKLKRGRQAFRHQLGLPEKSVCPPRLSKGERQDITKAEIEHYLKVAFELGNSFKAFKNCVTVKVELIAGVPLFTFSDMAL
jgi:hypothetical protein